MGDPAAPWKTTSVEYGFGRAYSSPMIGKVVKLQATLGLAGDF